MKRNVWLLLIVVTFVNCTNKTNVRWATFNIRYDNSADAENAWQYRKDRVCRYILEHQLDVVGTQEVLHHQFEDLKTGLSGYAAVGVGRDDGQCEGEYAAIFYNRERFEALDEGTFWLSETPEQVSKGWDAACKRIATWVKLKEKKSDKKILAINTHFDHIGQVARREGALLIMRKVQEIASHLPVVLTGDFNVTADSEAYRILTSNDYVLKDAHKIAETKKGVDYTYHAFARMPKESCSKIDFVFVTPHFQVVESEVVEENPKALLSDHNPQMVQMKF